MVALNTRQRDMLRRLLETEQTVVVHELAGQMDLTARQVNYGLKGVKQWLGQRGITLQITPGVGLGIHCSSAQRLTLLRELGSSAGIDLVLTAGQRRQLIAFTLLNSDQAINFSHLQKENSVSRSTILKDMEDVENWLSQFRLTIERRPNYGIWVEGREYEKRQALTVLLWGGTPFEDPIWSMTHSHGLHFVLNDDSHLLPVLQTVLDYQERLNVKSGMAAVAFAEADMGGRFTDQEVLHLALALSVQFERLSNGRILDDRPLDFEAISRLSSGLVWKVSEHLVLNRLPDNLAHDTEKVRWETALVAMHLLAGPKNDRWPGDSETEKEFEHLITSLLKLVSEAYEMPALVFDMTLRDGLITNLIPACLRSLFNLWTPPLKLANLLPEEKYPFEYEIAGDIAAAVSYRTGVELPMAEVSHLALILRAAYIRERPQELKDVLVVCPSGMATAQLLVARLRARFNRLGNLKVISVRELSSHRYAHVDLIISTVPIDAAEIHADTIQVHPLLLPEDIAAITQWLAY